ncbi:InlB B-repeat-containing protein [Alkalimonas delamerensis]|uniref:InlB B-repeat-containing protein n=1 Tax=Alkalimonas delamerensis TaxID=265981 RepID=A0ABT9GQP9_9GAMM|nr:InlB B-repeat-containing protein [Alkalimonas delamerensis]MDP4529303.1 InlB B-repeat-containing protein [Alkalimonas delamerensis]
MQPLHVTLRILLFALLTLWGWQAQADYIVSGAGDADANGTYVEHGESDGVPAFRKEGGAQTWYLKRCWGNYWTIEPYEFCDGMNYEVNSSSDTPPETGWGGWPAPAPTVFPAGPLVSFSSKTLFESLRNDGRFDESFLISHNLLDDDGFSGTVGDDLLQQGHAILTNLPAGLSASLVVNNSSELELRIAGTALSSSQADTVTDLTLQLLDAAFISGDASANINAEVADLTLQFRDLHTVGSSGDFATIAAAVAAAAPYDILQLAAETFTEKNISINKNLAIVGAGPAHTVVQAMTVPQAEIARIFRVEFGLQEVIISDMTLRYGNMDTDGGAILASSPLTLINCRLTENRVTRSNSQLGAALRANSTLLMDSCLVDHNIGTNLTGFQVAGGAIALNGKSTIVNSTLTGNQLIVPNASFQTRGGAIGLTDFAELTLINSTITENFSSGHAGGLGLMFVSASTKVQIYNSIIFGNTAGLAPDFADVRLELGVPAVYSHSIIGARWSDNVDDVIINLISEDPLLLPLADNGGPTLTMAFQAGSPALGAGVLNSDTPSVDQRGLPRGAAIDIGAFQAQQFTLTYDGNGSDSGAVAATSCYAFGLSCPLAVASATELERAGFTFGGWNTTADGTGTLYNPSDSITLSTDTTLFAQWQTPNYTISTSADNGSLICTPNPATAGSSVSCNASADEGYTFIGFGGDCSGYQCQFAAIDGDKTVTANFRLQESGDGVSNPDGLGEGDGNGDGTPDWEQPQVVSIDSQVIGQEGTFEAEPGAVFTNTDNLAAPTNLPRGVRMPLGRFSFDLAVPGVGDTANLTFYVDRSARIGGYHKWNHLTEQWDNIATSVALEGDKTKITFQLTDGDAYDVDRIANAIIQDPGGPTEDITRPVVPENQRFVVQVEPLDPELLQGTLSYRLASEVAGANADAAMFEIDAITGALRFKEAPDFEVPASAAASNFYRVQVVVEGAVSGSETIELEVTVIDDPGVDGVIMNLAGYQAEFTPGGAPDFATPESPAVQVGVFDTLDGGYLRLAQVAGTQDGSFALDDFLDAGAGPDEHQVGSTIEAGDTIFTFDGFGWLAVGTVDMQRDGQQGRDLLIHFNQDALALDAEIILQALLYSAPTDGSREYRVVLSDGVDVSEQVTFTLSGMDTTAPALVETMPADDATDVAVSAPLVLTFNEAVKVGSGILTLTEQGHSVFEIDASDTAAVVFQGKEVRIAWPEELSFDQTYQVSWPAGWVQDLAGNDGVAETLSFTTAEPASFTITFDSAGGSPVPAITQNFGSQVDAPPVPVREGHSFQGWTPALPETMPAENLTLTAQWSLNSYTVSFVDWNGDVLKTESVNHGAGATAPAAPTRVGYSFTGWSPADFSNIKADSMVTAHYNVNSYTLSFDSAGGSAVAGASYDFGAPVTAPTAPMREGYTFSGWNPALPDTMLANNLVVIAQWTVNQYTLSFDSAGGSEVAAITADFGSAIEDPAVPTREGFTFVGWSPELPATMPAEDVVATAQWTQDSFTVSVSLIGEGSVTPASQQVNFGQSASFALSVTDNTFVQIDSSCAASRSGNDIVTAAIKEDCSITLVVHPAVQSKVDDSSPAGSLETRRFRIMGGAGEQVLSAIQQTRSGSTTWLDLAESATLLRQAEDGSYLFSAERTGRYSFEFTDSVSGEQVSVSFDVLPYLAFTASSQPVQQDVTAQVRLWLSDEPIDYPVRAELEGTLASVVSSIELRAEDKLRKPLLATATAVSDGTVRLRSTGLEQALLGTPVEHRLAVQTALPPLALKASAEQDGQQTLVVNRHGGVVHLSAEELSGAAATFSWQALGLSLQGEGANVSFDPAGLATGRYFVQLTAEAGERSGELELALNVIAECPVADCSNTGSSGIPASQNSQAGQSNRLPICPQAEGNNRVSRCEGQGTIFAEVPSQYQLTLGLFSEQQSWQSGQFGMALTEGSLSDTGYQQLGFVVNMDVMGLESPGESVPIAIPMPAGQSIPANAVWRKLVNGLWQDFVEDANNRIDSAPRNALGNCPGVSSDAWRPSLNEGDACIRLTIEDGGPNDDDGRANGVIRDPGVLAVQQTASISFDSAGGSGLADITALVGSALTEPAAPEREGYSFMGWSPAFPETMPAEDVTLTAQWQINQYLIQFDVAGGQAMADLVLDFGAEISAPTPVRAGYTFMGWSPALPATMPANDVQVTALWQPSSVSVTSKGGSLGVLSALLLAGLLLVRRSKAWFKAGCAALCLLPLLAFSQDFYAGAQGGITHSHSSGSLASAVERKLNAEGISGTVTLNSNSDQAYRIFAGYRFNEWLAAELGWLDLGEAQLHYDGLPVNQARVTLLAQPQRGRGAELSLVGQLAQHEVWQPYLRLALFDNRSRYAFTGPAAEPVERRAGMRLGLEFGLGYQLSSEWQLMAAAAQYDTKHFNTRLFSVGVRYSF